MDPRTTRSPSLSSSIGSRRSTQFAPLSSHGMPKDPSLLSPDGSVRPHRFSGTSMPSSPQPSEPPEPPLSPMSPPMSARSFGTFIDSEPSTPAYSPRMGSTWDGSTLVLLSPVSATSPKTTEPAWQMMTPIQKPSKSWTSKPTNQPSAFKDNSLDGCLAGPAQSIQQDSSKENCPPTETESEQTDKEKHTSAAPFERLASRVKSLLKKKTDTEKLEKKATKKRKDYFELDRVETVHWTEM